MDRMRFTSRLTEDDIYKFLCKYGGFLDFTIIDNMKKTPTELIIYFASRGKKYKLYCEDFGMTVTEVFNSVESSVREIRPSADDWFCFLKSKYGMDYSIHYANLFDAKEIIFEKSKYISQISFNEFAILIKNILSYWIPINSFNTDIIEVESFFQSERRFFVSGPGLKKPFYMRVSDFQVIHPGRLSYKFRTIMEKMFGKEYLDDYKKAFKSTICKNITV